MSNGEFLQRDIRYIKGVGEKRAALYARLGIATVGQLLRHYPRGYVDMSQCADLAELPTGSTVAVRAVVDKKAAPARLRGGRTLARVFASTERGQTLELIYFNNAYAPQKLSEGEEYVFYGKLQGDLLRRQMVNPVTVSEQEQQGLTPQYPLTEGLSSRNIAANVRSVLQDDACRIPEPLPQALLSRYKLISREQAVRTIHFPEDLKQAAAAKRRLVFEELLQLSLGIKMRREGKRQAGEHAFADTDFSAFLSALPFTPTGAQLRCMGEIAADMAKSEPMSRLLQGDVGSGKTAVAAAAVYLAAKNGCQSAVMAPTEVLAEQHAETFRRFLEPFGIRVALLTGSVKGKPRTELLRHIAAGDADLIVGTHALISSDVVYKRLGLVVADEQHRFGVAQRAALSQKGALPHTLVMSATPIPRTLALIIYGDLDISLLDEMPKGRRSVKTLLVDESYRNRYLGFVRKTVEEGHQVYIVCPLVEESEALGDDTLSASEYYKQLQESWLPDIPMALMHGRMTNAEKAAVMQGFREGSIKVLVSTTVIEVGVDCPNATLMIIENAERFGLSTLHQLRGRVGRGGEQSWCVLVSSKEGETAQSRLQLLTQTDDGFAIAREDLKMRGPGDFLGRRQHGLPNLALADLADDEKTLYAAADAADELLRQDATLASWPLLQSAVQALFADTAATLN
ncbi:MAG: ATP-dependent DNA helicase RecG [Oscillospiraceae bacterium]|nr:ATP-dependent DNA helicase RecG [Oscillospiraceae bacterium]